MVEEMEGALGGGALGRGRGGGILEKGDRAEGLREGGERGVF